MQYDVDVFNRHKDIKTTQQALTLKHTRLVNIVCVIFSFSMSCGWISRVDLQRCKTFTCQLSTYAMILNWTCSNVI